MYTKRITINNNNNNDEHNCIPVKIGLSNERKKVFMEIPTTGEDFNKDKDGRFHDVQTA